MDTAQVCSLCNDTGWKAIGEGRERRVTRCDCRREERVQRSVEQARIPERYKNCDFATYKPANELQLRAHKVAETFAAVYPVEKRGLVFVGSIGIGKTHLAVAILKALIHKGITCLFYDYGDLLKEIQDSYNHESNRTELGILDPVFNAEVLVLDELGAVKHSEWVWNTVSYIVNTRYNKARTTIFTTNFPDAPPAKSAIDNEPNKGRAFQINVEETLGDRIGERMRSRLHEMCQFVPMTGEDYRTRKGNSR